MEGKEERMKEERKSGGKVIIEKRKNEGKEEWRKERMEERGKEEWRKEERKNGGKEESRKEERKSGGKVRIDERKIGVKGRR